MSFSDISSDVFANNVIPHLDLHQQREFINDSEDIRHIYQQQIQKMQQKIRRLSQKLPLHQDRYRIIRKRSLLHNTIGSILTTNQKIVIMDIAQDPEIADLVAQICISDGYVAYLKDIKYNPSSVASFIEALCLDRQDIYCHLRSLVVTLTLYPDIVHRMQLRDIIAILSECWNKTLANIALATQDNVWSHPNLQESFADPLGYREHLEKLYQWISDRYKAFSELDTNS